MTTPSVDHTPGGPELARWLAGAPGVCARELSDGAVTLSYAEAAACLDRLDDVLAPCRETPRPIVAVECSQSVPGALALLYLLSREVSAVLLPELAEGTAKEAGLQRFIPSFCSHVVTAAGRSVGGGDRIVDAPERSIRIAANPDFGADPQVAALRGPDLYLRTSGSTGSAKLARMSHARWLRNAMACVERWGLAGDDRLAVPVPIFHSYGFGAAFLPGLLAGAAMDFGGGGNLLRYLAREERFAPNVAFLTPALCEMFLAVRKAPRPYRLVVTAGDRIKRETMAAFEPRFGPLLNLYGSAEMGAVSSASPADPERLRLGTAGRALAGVELRVEPADPAPESAPGGRSGRLFCLPRDGLSGYLIQRQPGAGWSFAPRADDEPFDTGDLARLRDDGYLEILGRSGLSAKRDGLMVVFADVEAALERIAGVARAVVVAAGESRRGSRLVAVCLPAAAGGSPADAGEVRRRCFALLPRYAVPDEVLWVADLPHLPSGKIDRRAVRDLVS